MPGAGGIGDDSLLPRAKFASEEFDWTLGEFGQLTDWYIYFTLIVGVKIVGRPDLGQDLLDYSSQTS